MGTHLLLSIDCKTRITAGQAITSDQTSNHAMFRGYTNPLEMSSRRPSYFRYYIRAGTFTAYVVPLLTMLNCSTRGAVKLDQYAGPGIESF